MADVAVVGVPDDLSAELVVAVVVPAAGDGSRSTLPRSKRTARRPHGLQDPTTSEQVETLPRNAYGKVLKRELRGERTTNA